MVPNDRYYSYFITELWVTGKEEKPINAIYEYLDKQTKTKVFLISLIQLLILGIIDHYTGFEYAFSLFYIVPVVQVTWSIGQRSGVVFSIAAVITWQLANTLAGETFSSLFVPVWNSLIRLGFFLLIVWQLGYAKSLLQKQERIAQTDFLTGAWNSRAFEEKGSALLHQALASRQPFSMIYFDMDNFKTVNDLSGHQAGDKVLMMFVETVHTCVRKSDIIARLGGDEFMLALPSTSIADAQHIGLRIQEEFAHRMTEEGLPVTLSAGLVTYCAEPLMLDDLIRIADDNMYLAKRAGKNQIYGSIYPVNPDIHALAGQWKMSIN